MNISASSSALTLVYVFVLLWILMGVDIKALSRKKRWVSLGAIVLLCVYNEVLSAMIPSSTYVRLLFLNMHLPMFLLYLYIARRGVIKTGFMIMTALVFSSPPVIVGNILHNRFSVGILGVLISHIIVYLLMLLMAFFVFRSVFVYLLTYSNNSFFLLFSLVPVAYYIYILAYMNVDISSLDSRSGFWVRLLPNLEVFGFYFLLPYIYKTFREKMVLKSARNALKKTLTASEDQIALLNETNTQMALYRHDMRHQLLLLDGLLSCGNTEQAQEFIKTVMADLDTFTPKKFCENETVNLLCSSYDSKAQRMGVRLEIKAILPKSIPLTDTELCSVISNGLENALRAVSHPEVSDKWVAFYCEVKQNKLFIQMKNPYADQVVIRDGLPVCDREGHGYGCYSIQAITQHNGGLCSFEAHDGLFALRLSFPLPDNYGNQETNNTQP